MRFVLESSGGLVERGPHRGGFRSQLRLRYNRLQFSRAFTLQGQNGMENLRTGEDGDFSPQPATLNIIEAGNDKALRALAGAG